MLWSESGGRMDGILCERSPLTPQRDNCYGDACLITAPLATRPFIIYLTYGAVLRYICVPEPWGPKAASSHPHPLPSLPSTHHHRHAHPLMRAPRNAMVGLPRHLQPIVLIRPLRLLPPLNLDVKKLPTIFLPDARHDVPHGVNALLDSEVGVWAAEVGFDPLFVTENTSISYYTYPFRFSKRTKSGGRWGMRQRMDKMGG